MYFLQREIPQRNNFHGTELDAWERMPALPDLLVQHVQCTSLSRRNLPQAMVSPKTNFRIEVTQLLEMGYSCSDIMFGWKSLCCISHARSAFNIKLLVLVFLTALIKINQESLARQLVAQTRL